MDKAIDCNCSMWQKRGGLLWFAPREALTLETPATAMGTYTFNTHKLRPHFCPTCGISPFGEGTGPAGQNMAAVNVRSLDGIDLTALKISTFDGRSK